MPILDKKQKSLSAVARESLAAKVDKRILGIDPGYARAGWAVLENQGQKLKLIKFGCVETSAKLSHAERLKKLNLELEKIIKKHKPDTLAIEELFFFKNLKTAIKVAESRGVALLTAIDAKLEIHEYTPLQIKQALVGYGRAEKNQIGQMVKIILSLKEIPKPDDITDAIAVTITCAHSIK